jgi:hypothetical protein
VLLFFNSCEKINLCTCGFKDAESRSVGFAQSLCQQSLDYSPSFKNHSALMQRLALLLEEAIAHHLYLFVL